MSSVFGIVMALTAALMYGSADFTGGVASRRINQFQVMVITVAIGVPPLVLFAILWQEGMPSTSSLMWAALAGIIGTMGLAPLYRGLATGSAAIVSPTAAVVGATLPLVYGSIIEGLPSAPKLAGFLLALLGIWLVARPNSDSLPGHGQGLMLGIVAGTAFGGYFICIAQVQPGAVFIPLAMAKLAAIPFVLAIVATRGLRIPSPIQTPMALLSGVLDAVANAFYLIARQHGRLDVATVLASLYPAVTVVMARLVYKEAISRSQWLGLTLCLAAIGLIVY